MGTFSFPGVQSEKATSVEAAAYLSGLCVSLVMTFKIETFHSVLLFFGENDVVPYLLAFLII